MNELNNTYVMIRPTIAKKRLRNFDELIAFNSSSNSSNCDSYDNNDDSDIENRNPMKKFHSQKMVSIDIQCTIMDEELVCSTRQTNDYWKIMVYKRREALNNVTNENKDLHELIEQLNEENEHLREENKDLLDLFNEANSLKVNYL